MYRETIRGGKNAKEQKRSENKVLIDRLKKEALGMRDEAQLILKKTKLDMRPFGVLPWYVVVFILIASFYLPLTCLRFIRKNKLLTRNIFTFLFCYHTVFNAIFYFYSFLWYSSKNDCARKKAFETLIERNGFDSINIYDPEKILLGDKHELKAEITTVVPPT